MHRKLILRLLNLQEDSCIQVSNALFKLGFIIEFIEVIEKEKHFHLVNLHCHVLYAVIAFIYIQGVSKVDFK